MCGIFGVVAPAEKHLGITLKQGYCALSLLRHRGPDALRLTGFRSVQDHSPLTTLSQSEAMNDTHFSMLLGHSRLSIIDLSQQASQPMQLGREPIWITYNGEIYNFRELREELKASGYQFNSHSDTEVILGLYHRDGPQMVKRLNGMFAFVIWDAKKQQLFFARDRYGIKPLYYTILKEGSFAFASELKALLALPGVDKSINPVALSEHFTFQNTYGDKILLKEVHLLQPGHMAQLKIEDLRPRIEQYWDPVFDDVPFDPSQIEFYKKEVRDCFEQGVSRQLIGDVPIGSFLSGGMDTGAITAVSAQKIPELNTFTCGFDVEDVSESERPFDERDNARFLAQHFNTRHHEMNITSSALSETLPQVVWHLDDFRAGISYQSFLVSQMVREQVTVVLSGVGGDELLAGYPWRYRPMMDISDPTAFEKTYYDHWARILSEEQKQQLFSKSLTQSLNGFHTFDSFRHILSQCQAGDSLHKALYFDLKTFLHGLLIVEDRLSMAHSVESRVPFLDNDFVDLCLKLPSQAKLNLETNTSKWILKEALKGLLPDRVISQKKQGFTPPDASWYRGVNQPYIESILLSERSLDRGLFQPNYLRTLLEEHYSQQANHRFLIWSLLCLEWWQRLLIDNDPLPEKPPVTLIEAPNHV